MAFLFRIVRLLVLLAIALALVGAMLLWTRPGPIGSAAAPDLAAAPGAFSRARIAGLGGATGLCRATLDRAGVAYTRVPSRDGGECGFDDAVAWQPGGARALGYAPARPVLACPLAAGTRGMGMERRPAGRGRASSAPSSRGSIISAAMPAAASTVAEAAAERARTGRCAGRRRLPPRRWPPPDDRRRLRGTGAEARFLHEMRDGACRLFGTTLSPDYNAAHRDHLHLDGANRGGFGYCR